MLPAIQNQSQQRENRSLSMIQRYQSRLDDSFISSQNQSYLKQNQIDKLATIQSSSLSQNNSKIQQQDQSNKKARDILQSQSGQKSMQSKLINYVPGSNGQSAVYCLTIPQIQKQIALKIKKVQKEERDRECLILQHFQVLNHPNIIQLQHYFSTYGNDVRSIKNFMSLYIQGTEHMNILTEYLPTDMHQFINSYKAKNKPIQKCFVKIYSFQLIRAVAFIHENNIFHRNIQPANLLMNTSQLQLKLCDFSCAKQISRGEVFYILPYQKHQKQQLKSFLILKILIKESFLDIGNRFYRAPELLLGSKQYNYAIDLWAIGCIIFEMLTLSQPFFGNTNEDVLCEIIKQLGTPNQKDLIQMGSQILDLNLPQIKPATLKHKIASYLPDEGALEILNKLLQYQPSKRGRCVEYLYHPFFNEIKKPNFKLNGKEIPRIFELTKDELSFPIYASYAEKIIPQWYSLRNKEEQKQKDL